MLAMLLAVVLSTNSTVSYACNGSTAAFQVNYPYLSQNDLVVTSTTAAGAVTTLARVTDFTLSVTSTVSTATLTLLAPATSCPTGSTLKIARVVPLTQPLNLTTQTSLDPKVLTTAYDRLAMQVQQTDLKAAAATNPTPTTVNNNSSVLGVAPQVARPLVDVLNGLWVSVCNYESPCPSGTDDTTAIQTALSTGKNVFFPAGATYIVNGGLTQSTARQAIDATGAVVKLKNGAGSKGILTLSGVGARVTGGEWDLNAANNAAGDPYGHWAVLLHADYAVAEKMYVHDSFGICIKGMDGQNYQEARFNRVEKCALADIYFDGSPTVDTIGSSIHNNKVDITNNTSVGIYVTSASPYTFVQRRWRIQDNEVVGLTAGSSSSSVGITGRGLDGIVSGNHVLGTNIGISVDIPASDESVIVSHNRVEGANGGTIAFGIEANGSRAVVQNNIVKGGRTGITGSGPTMDYWMVKGNQLVEQTIAAIFIDPGAGGTAQHALIADNSIISTLTAQNGAIRLAGDCRYSVIRGNLVRGPGSAGHPGGRAVFLDTVNSDVDIVNNRFGAWERPVSLYNAAAVAQTRILFDGNDLSEDMTTTPDFFMVLEGLATAGGALRITNNFTGQASVVRHDIIDLLLNVREQISNNFASPEANFTAGPGSILKKTNGGQASLWIKEVGTGNTGWAAADPGSGTTFATLGTPANGALLYCSDCTIANPCAGGGTGAMAKRLNGIWVCN